MPALREYLGTRCPTCRKDILQAAPTTNRMPGQADLAWCPTCRSTMSLEELARGGSRSGGFLGKLFGKPQRG